MNICQDSSLQLLRTGKHKIEMYPGWGTGMRNCYVIHYIISGTGYLETLGKKYTIHAGESFLITPYTPIHYYPDPESPWMYTWIDFSSDHMSELFSEINWNAGHPICRQQFDNNLLQLYMHLQSLDIYTENKNEAFGVFTTILGIYIDAMAPVIDNTNTAEYRLSTALNIIHTNYYRPNFNIETLCKILNLSAATIYRLFVNNVGLSPVSYLQHYRIEQAKKMLSANVTVKVTALSCGYDNSLYFSRAFKNKVGISPSKYCLELNQTVL